MNEWFHHHPPPMLYQNGIIARAAPPRPRTDLEHDNMSPHSPIESILQLLAIRHQISELTWRRAYIVPF